MTFPDDGDLDRRMFEATRTVVVWDVPGFELHPPDAPRTIRCTSCDTSAELGIRERNLGGFRVWASEHDCMRSAEARKAARR